MNELNKTSEQEVRCCIAVQKLGQATNEEILEKLTSDKIKITAKQVEKATNNLQKKGLLSLSYDNSSGLAEKSYNMAKSIFSRDIPIAHYKDIVDTSNQEIKALIDELEIKKGTNKGRLPDHRDYYMCKVVFEVKDKVLGFMPFKKQGVNEHYREGKDIILLPTHFRAWIGHNLRILNKSNSVRNYLGYSTGYVKVKGKTTFEQFPVLDGGQGRGIVKYEAIPKGSLIETKFRVPKSDFNQTEFKAFLTTIGEMPIRGFGGRAITGYGRLGIKEFKVE